MKRFHFFVLLVIVVIAVLVLRGGDAPPGVFSSTGPFTFRLPFLAQAPREFWNSDLQNACEEANMLMLYVIRTGRFFSSEDLEKELMNMIAYEKEVGIGPSMDIESVSRMLRDYFHISEGRVVTLSSVDELRMQLRFGVVVAPAHAPALQNPYFRRPPPLYHMLTVIGYDDVTREFIVNDPGTKFGKHYRYGYDVLFNALHDWTGDAATIEMGEKRALLVPFSALVSGR